MILHVPFLFFFFFFNDTATTEIYTLSLHDALPIFRVRPAGHGAVFREARSGVEGQESAGVFLRPPESGDRKSTRLNSSHDQISYAVFCLKKKKNKNHSSTILIASYSRDVS